MSQTANMAAAARAGGGAGGGASGDGSAGAQVSETMSYDAFNDSMITSSYPVTNMEMDSSVGGVPAQVVATTGEGVLIQAAPAMDVTGQALRSPIFMTPMQVQMHQQLKAKHAELFKKIIEQQEELRKVSEQLLMTQYGLMPVNLMNSDQQIQQAQNQTNANFSNVNWQQQQQNDLQNQSNLQQQPSTSSMPVNQLQAALPLQQQQQRNFMQQQQL